MLGSITATSALTVYIPPAIYAAGSSIEGEVAIDFRQLREENIEEVQVRLRGSSHTAIHRGETTLNETVRLVHETTSLWTRGSAYPAPGSDTLRVPFAFALPESLPPSFHCSGFMRGKSAHVRYSLAAVGVRKGALNLNKRHRVPLAVLLRDEAGAALKAAHATHGWKRFAKEDSIRRGLWGEYSKVHVELSLPDIPVLPLFSDIPYAITVTTTTPPQPRRSPEADPAGSKPLFPPVPQSADELEFALHRTVRLRAKYMRASESGDVALFIGKKRVLGSAPVETELPEKEWTTLREAERALVDDGGEKKSEKGKGSPDVIEAEKGEGEGKGSWVQRATFRSVFRLNCPPAFAVHNIECSYDLVVRVPFPGIGNSLKLEVPVNVTSGIDKPFAKELATDSDSAPPPLDLPPAYWDTNSRDWDVDEKD
ncbi:hypothetical protein GSI_03584 [Ganoderma sinense ZZ0214-1]|uniref:Arrestin-like N-terminal domain-containing protein n=1 Tax=Ganoderma sinense ZZ0214-1 TaxID=1077348 RepID=A0A2G8SK08_9APHY|nr:hypothetical protein GSI_03584 [Ganoderma sinense ZZ0214-1]